MQESNNQNHVLEVLNVNVNLWYLGIKRIAFFFFFNNNQILFYMMRKGCGEDED